jgi:hypothetical protein
METDMTIKKLKSVPTGQWFSVVNKAGVNLTNIICDLIDAGDHFQISSDWTKFKRLDDF